MTTNAPRTRAWIHRRAWRFFIAGGVGAWMLSFAVLLALGVGPLGLIGCEDAASAHDRSTPESAAACFFDCLKGGEAPGMIDCVVQDEVQPDLAQQFAEIVSAGLAAEDLTVLPKVDAARLDGATVTIEAEVARVELPPDPEATVERPQVITLRKNGDGWRVDLLETTGMSGEQAKAYLARLVEATKAVKTSDDAAGGAG